MSERDDFMAWIGSRLKDAEIALHNGDAAPRFATSLGTLPALIQGGGPASAPGCASQE